MADCTMWSMLDGKVYKKCSIVYKLENRIKKLKDQLKEGHHCSSFEMCGGAGDEYEKRIEQLRAENKELKQKRWANLNTTRCMLIACMDNLKVLEEDMRCAEYEAKKDLKGI